MASSKVDTSNYVRCHEAIQLVCHRAAPLMDNVLQNWHIKKQIQPCSRPKPRPCAQVGKPKPSSSCQNCVAWGAAVQAEYYPQSLKGSIPWSNINPTCFSRSYMEVSKAFVLRLPKTQIFAKAADFDSASLLMLMMHFGEFHKSDHASYQIIKEVSSIRNTLSHMKLKDNLHLSDQLLNTYFDKIHDLVSCLERLYPQQFTRTDADDVRSELNKILQSLVTVSMTEEALCPLTDGMKDIIFKTMEDQFRQQSQEIQAHSSGLMKQVDQKIGKQTQGIEQAVAVGFQGTADRLSQDLKDHMDKQKTAFVKDQERQDQGLMKQVEQQIGKHTQGIERAVAGGFQGSTEVLSEKLSQEMQDLKHHMDETATTAIKDHERLDQGLMKQVKQQFGKQTQGIKQAMADGFQGATERLSQEMQDLKDDRDERATASVKHQERLHQEEIQTWKRRLKVKYMRERKDIRFGQSRRAIADTDDIFVDLELLRDEEAIMEGDKPSLEGGESSVEGEEYSSNNEYEVGASSKQRGKCRKLNSYQDLLTLVDKHKQPLHHILVRGNAGCGKTTLMSRIAYEWAKTVEPSETSIPGSQSQRPKALASALSAIEMVLVLDARKFKREQTLSQAIEKQLLPGVSIDVDKVLSSLGDKCLILIDGYDELPKGIEDHALDSAHLSECFVIVTTRPHKVDEFCVVRKGYVHVQLSGFSQEKSFQYVKKFFCNSKQPALAETLTKKIKGKPILKILSTFPILLVMMCLLWKHSLQKAVCFQSMTQLYGEAMKYLNKAFEKQRDRSIDHILCMLGEPALKGLFENNLQISSDKFADKELLNQSFEIGVAFEEEDELVDAASVTFIHKTFQEYCAAIYLASLVDNNRDKFDYHLNRIKKSNVDEMEYLLRFCCGLNVEAGEAILSHVFKLYGNKCDNQLKLPIILLYERKLSTNTDPSPELLDTYLKELGKCETLLLKNAEVIAAISFFAKETNAISRVMFRSIKDLRDEHGFDDATTMMKVLRSMSSLVSVQVNCKKWSRELSDEDTHSLSKSITSFKVKGSYWHYTDVAPLPRIVRCVPSLAKGTLLDIKPNKTFDLPCLSINYYGVHGRGYPTDMSLVSPNGILSYMDSLKYVSYTQITLVKKILDVVTFVSVLRCMPLLVGVRLKGISLTGEVAENAPPLSKALKELTIKGNCKGYNVRVVTLVSLLRCIPSLTKVRLYAVNLMGKAFQITPLLKRLEGVSLTGEVIEITPPWNKSLEDLTIEADNFKCINVQVVTLVSLLRCIPSLKRLRLLKVYLIGKADPITPQLNTSLQDISFEGQSDLKPTTESVIQLFHFLRCMPSFVRVRLQSVNLSGGLIEFEEFTGTVSVLVTLLKRMRSFKENMNICPVSLTGELDEITLTLKKSRKYLPWERTITVNLLLTLLHCMPEHSKVTLKDFNLNDDDDVTADSVTDSPSVVKGCWEKAPKP